MTWAASIRRIPGLGAALIGGCLAVALGVLFALRGPALPDAWITPLQEGLTEKHVRLLYGDGAHAGSSFRSLISLLAPEQAGAPLRAVVRMNVALSLVNAGLFLVIARRVLGWAAAIAFTLVFAANPVALHAALSELPSALLTTHFLLGVAAAGVAVDERASPGARWALLGALCGIALLAALIRVETLALSLPASLGLVALLKLGERRIDEAWARFRRAAIGVLARPIALILAALWAIWLVGTLTPIGLGFDLLDPFNVSAFALPATLTLFLPIGPAILFVLGIVHTLRHPARFLLLPVGILLLYKAYYSASHAASAPFELLRYMTLVMPIALFAALFGWREVEAFAARLAWSDKGLRAARTATALSFCCWTPAGWALLTDFNGAERSFGLERLLVRRDQQVEARFLLELVERHPECTFVTRAVPAGGMATERAHASIPWEIVIFGRKYPRPISEPLAERAISDAASVRAPAGCLLYYRGVDCNLSSAGDVCANDSAGLRQLAQRVPPNLPYYSHVELAPQTSFGLYVLRD